MRNKFRVLFLLSAASCCSLFFMGADTAGPDASASNPLAGKFVVIERDRYRYPVMENVILRDDFLCYPQGKYESWLPLHKIDELKVFDRRADADAYHDSHRP